MKGVEWSDLLLFLVLFYFITASISVYFGIGVINANLPEEQKIRSLSFWDLVNPFSDKFIFRILWNASSVSSSFMFLNVILISLTLILVILLAREVIKILRGA